MVLQKLEATENYRLQSKIPDIAAKWLQFRDLNLYFLDK
jgi:hypothetical protein